MSDQTASTGSLPSLLSSEELYDMLMGGIEPDLTIENLPNVIADMQNDAPEQKAEKLARYARAIAEYDRRLTEHKAMWDKALTAYRHSSLNDLASVLVDADASYLESIEREFTS